MNRNAFWCPPLVRPGGVISQATRYPPDGFGIVVALW